MDVSTKWCNLGEMYIDLLGSFLFSILALYDRGTVTTYKNAYVSFWLEYLSVLRSRIPFLTKILN